VSKTVTFNVPADTTIGSISIVTTGIPDLDFRAKSDDSSSTLCKGQKYPSATSCTVDVTFAPLAPGLRKGAVELLTSKGALIASTYVYGKGVSPQLAFDPAATVLIPNNFPLGGFVSAIDAAGNIYVTAREDSSLEKMLVADSYKKIEASNPKLLPAAIDGAGNYFGFESVQGNEGPLAVVYETTAASGYKTSKQIALGLNNPSDIALDSSGNIFATEYDSGLVREALAADGYTTIKTLGGRYSGPEGIALDTAGNVFILSNSGGIQEILAAGGYTTSKILAGGEAFGLTALTLDAADNVYAVVGGTVVELLAATHYDTVVKDLSVATNVSAVMADPWGNLFLTNWYGGERWNPTYNYKTTELVRSQPPASLTFLNTPIGHTSSDSPKSVQFQNVGNATLKGTGNLLDEPNFTVVPGSGLVPDCTAGTLSLTAGAICNLSFDFTPGSSGLLTTELTLTDTSANATDATQSLILSGTGASTAAIAKVSPSSLNFGSLAYPGSATRTLTVTNIGTGTLAVLPSSNGPGTVITGNNCGDGIGAGKSCELQIEFKPDHLGMNHNTVTIGTNTATNPTVYVHGTATGVGSLTTLIQFGTDFGRNARTQPLTVTNYGVPGTVTVATQSGTTPFSVISNGCTAGITDGNSCTIEVQYLPTQSGSVKGYLELVPSIGAKQVIGMEGNEY
jgi:hypothetical protein